MGEQVLRVDLADRNLVDRYLHYYRLNPVGSLADRCLRLQTRFHTLAVAREIQLSECDRCGGRSDRALPVCPFCGEGGLLEAGETDPVLPEIAAAVETTSLALAPPGGTPAERLDACIAALNGCARAHRSNLYRVACLLRQVRDEELWKHRFDGRGNPVYAGYLDCVSAEVGLSRAHAKRLVSCAEQFTAEEFEEWGAHRLRFSLRLPAGERREWLEHTKKIPISKLGPAAVQRRRQPDDPGPYPRLPRGRQRVVCAVPLGQVIARLYARPKTHNEPVGAVTRDAVSLDDDPWTQVQIADDLWARLTVRRAADGTGALALGFELRKGTLLAREDGR